MSAAAFVDAARNIFGPLEGDERERLAAVLARPTLETWNDAHGLIVAPRFTLWQAWLAVDPSAPRSGRCTDQHGRIVREWARIPDQLTLYRAIRQATRATRG